MQIEVTETALPVDPDAAAAALATLAAYGFGTALDDFGVGYASLSHLRSLQLTEVKIDRAFVAGVAEVGEDREVVAALIQLAHGLGLSVCAEGVETAEAADWLRAGRLRPGAGLLLLAARAVDRSRSRRPLVPRPARHRLPPEGDVMTRTRRTRLSLALVDAAVPGGLRRRRRPRASSRTARRRWPWTTSSAALLPGRRPRRRVAHHRHRAVVPAGVVVRGRRADDRRVRARPRRGAGRAAGRAGRVPGGGLRHGAGRLAARHYDAVMSAMTDTPERRANADFVNYFRAGSAVVIQRGNPRGIHDLGGLCGETVAVEAGTVHVDLLARSQARLRRTPRSP